MYVLFFACIIYVSLIKIFPILEFHFAKACEGNQIDFVSQILYIDQDSLDAKYQAVYF